MDAWASSASLHNPTMAWVITPDVVSVEHDERDAFGGRFDELRGTVGAEALPQTACTLSSIDVVFRVEGRMPTMTALQRQCSTR